MPCTKAPLTPTVLVVALGLALAGPAAADPGGRPAAHTTAVTAPSPRPPVTPPLVVDRPERRRPYREGQPERMLLAGVWYFQVDDARTGIGRGLMRQRSLAGWQPVTVPNDWNGADTVSNRSSVGWYRKEFTLPREPRGTVWVARFEGASNSATVYLNGRKIGGHTGAYLPFEVDLKGIKKGRNSLVVRLSTLRSKNDLTHWRPARFNGYGTGGWWNFGGLSREVTVRPVGKIDIERAQALPRLRCLRCSARIEVRALVRNRSSKGREVRIAVRVEKRTFVLSSRRVPAAATREFSGTFTIVKPHLWRLRKGGLYSLHVTAATGKTRTATYDTSCGVRSLRKRADGVVLLNGKRLRLRGVSIQEDVPGVGAAWGPAQRHEAVSRIRQLGATVVRSHYPLHPALLEAFDRAGILVWEGAPVYQVQNDRLDLPQVRTSALSAVKATVLRDRGHASVLAYTVANELPDPIGTGQATFIRQAAGDVRHLDPTRLVALDRAARRAAPDDANPVLNELDAIGVNEYFGWYRSADPPLPPTVSSDLGPYLDELHRLHPATALFVTEFGAEASRDGPAAEKGTFAFQTQLIRDHLAIINARRYIGGAIIWALRDFRVHPTWSGGNPIPDPPYNHKGLIGVDGTPKEAFYEAKRAFALRR